MSTCDACRIERVMISPEIEDGGPWFNLCRDCYYRLTKCELRPLEYFNLVAKYGGSHDLLDINYDMDTGEALEPETGVVNAKDFPFPTLDDVRNDVERLIDFAVVEFDFNDETYLCLQQHDKQKIIESVTKRLNDSPYQHHKLYTIVAQGVGVFAADWVRGCLKQRDPDRYFNLAEVIAMCLPFEEAFGILTNQIETGDSKAGFLIEGLIYLRRNEVLDWIERQPPYSQNEHIGKKWGQLAAASNFSWERAKKWLAMGPPLNMDALYALFCCTVIVFQDPFKTFRNKRPFLINAPKNEEMAEFLNDYAQRDGTEEVRSLVDGIIDNLFEVGEMSYTTHTD